MKPIGTRSVADVERDRSECDTHAHARIPSHREVLRDVLVSQGIGIGIGAVAGGFAVGVRHGGLGGSVSSTATTDMLIVLMSAALGFVVGSMIGLVRASGMSQAATDRLREDFAECMSTRGYR